MNIIGSIAKGIRAVGSALTFNIAFASYCLLSGLHLIVSFTDALFTHYKKSVVGKASQKKNPLISWLENSIGKLQNSVLRDWAFYDVIKVNEFLEKHFGKRDEVAGTTERPTNHAEKNQELKSDQEKFTQEKVDKPIKEAYPVDKVVDRAEPSRSVRGANGRVVGPTSRGRGNS